MFPNVKTPEFQIYRFTNLLKNCEHIKYPLMYFKQKYQSFCNILFWWIWSVTHEGFNVCSVQAWLEFAQNRTAPPTPTKLLQILIKTFICDKSGPDCTIINYNVKWKN